MINHLPTILWHRRLYVIVSFVILFLVGLITAYTLPTIYRSSATLLVESQDLPTDIVQAPGTNVSMRAAVRVPTAKPRKHRQHQRAEAGEQRGDDRGTDRLADAGTGTSSGNVDVRDRLISAGAVLSCCTHFSSTRVRLRPNARHHPPPRAIAGR